MVDIRKYMNKKGFCIVTLNSCLRGKDEFQRYGTDQRIV